MKVLGYCLGLEDRCMQFKRYDKLINTFKEINED